MANRIKRRRKPALVDGHPTEMSAMLERHFEWLRVHNFSEETIRARDYGLNSFLLWCEDRGITKPAEVTRVILERYQRHLYNYRKANGQPLAIRSQEGQLAALKAFFKWLAKYNHIPFNPASEIELPRSEHRLPTQVLNPAQADQLLSQADSTSDLGIRDRAILETFYSTGMRRMELVALKIYDLDPGQGTVIIRQGKGKKDRVIPIGDRALAWIDKYLREVRPTLVVEPDNQGLFLGLEGKPLSVGYLTDRVHKYLKQARLLKRGSCHLLRHTCATAMLEGGADIRYVQEMLGHSNLKTTQVYTHVSIRKLKEVHTATHPAKLTRSPKPNDSGTESGSDR